MYDVETRALNKVIKRNSEGFSDDFMFRWNAGVRSFLSSGNKCLNLSSQIVRMNLLKNRSGKYLQYAFTEHCVTMLAWVLKSQKARQINIAIVHDFVALLKTS